ncbi:hypothetical protein L596_029402 [Steinernema carpocapsae]|uniref:ATP-dependent RNA helicase n=1 Tax=Steinernema carpocapsae TaxID=34508 RepID=A0A4U5LUJ2_STECR|nr:hypothetical protein L596_029402 [Steinernema carpocapsae]
MTHIDTLARFLTESFRHLRPGMSLLGLWGTMQQNKRLEVFAKFDSNTSGAACIATDVASRGLDFKNIDWVLQLDCPAEVDDYIHRVGRTARMNRKGEAALVLTPSQEKPMLERLKKAKIIPEQLQVAKKEVLDISKKMQSTIIQFSKLKEYAQRSFVSYIRSIYLMKYKDVFNVESIDFAALARSYGLADAPRVRFLKNAQKTKEPKEKTSKNEKSTKELVAALLKQRPEESDDEAIESDVEEKVDFEAGSEENAEESDNDVLKVSRTDVFNVLKKPGPDEPVACRQPKTKKVSKREIIKKALRGNTAEMQANKKVFDDEESEEEEPEIVAKPAAQEGPQEESKAFDIDAAKKELRARRAADKKELKEFRKAKKEALEANKRGRKVGSDEELDLGRGSDEDGSDGGVVGDTSWLVDPDNEELRQDRIEQGFLNEDDSEFEEPEFEKVTKKTRKRKRESIEDTEAKALKLLGL